MTADTIRSLVKRQPFLPFVIYLNDGRKLEVKHPDFVMLPPGWSSTAIIAFPDDRFDIVSIRNVASVESEGPFPVIEAKKPKDEGETP